MSAVPWHLGMMCAFDLETSGTDTESDRIVTACLAWVDGSGQQPPEVREWLAWPEVDIPQAATDIHGITTAHAREHGLPSARVAGEVADSLVESAACGVAVVAFNASFDLTLLDRETRRHGLDPLGPGLEAAKALVVDPYVLDKALDPYRKGKRTLADVAAHYRVRQEDAHNATGDAIAAARIAWKIAVVYPHVARMTATELHAYQARAKREQAASFRDYLRKQGRDEPVDGSWPLRPWDLEAAAR
ncbi:MAG TPA: 3'-5' exonuclease [Streptosporangiaceae bacterium]|nr:3'-5' exonuclease [Streptosporangiaceae bacterium]